MSHLPRAWAELSAEALIHNIKRIRALSDAKVMAVVKANAYGHKMQWAANTLAPYVDAFAIATLDEGIELRALHANVPITCLSGFYAPVQIEAFKTH
ncbi:MAG: alanine racemase, partial [Arenicellales bacterium]